MSYGHRERRCTLTFVTLTSKSNRISQLHCISQQHQQAAQYFSVDTQTDLLQMKPCCLCAADGNIHSFQRQLASQTLSQTSQDGL